jgi:hypothetical protein
MLVRQSMIVASIGQYGPFKDENGKPELDDQGQPKIVPYVELLDPDGGGVFRATRGSGATGDPPPVASLASVELEFYVRDGGIKCRYQTIGGAEYKQPKAA